MKKQKKRQKGITLIALVITIIVLLILAGVSISLVVGNNGILGRAEDTVDIHQKAKVLEEAEMILSGWQTDYIVEKTPYEGRTENTPSGADVSCAGGKVTVTDNKTGTVYEASFSESAGLGEWKEVGTSEVTPTVPTNVKVTGVGLDKTNIILLINSTKQLTATIEPSNATNKEILWQSTNETVATVSKATTASGTAITVTCKAAGTTTITATAADGSGKSASLSLTVRDPLTSLTLDKTQTTLLYGGVTTTVTASTTPSDYDANNLTWTIGDTSLATISGSGKTRTITSNNTKKTGETTLTISGGGKTVTMKVSIVNFQTTTYSYTGTVQQVDLPAGTYKLEVWRGSRR